MLDSIDYYSKNATKYYENTIDLNMDEILDKFIKLLPEGASVLDLGCGSGRDSLSMIEQGLDVTAIDGSKELCELAQIHIGQDVLHMKFDEMNFNDVFDGVWACASLLHVSRKEIDCIIDKIITSLKLGGIFYLSVKYGDFSGIIDYRYYQKYKTKTMKELISKHKELEIIEIWKTEDIREDRENQIWLNVLLRKVDPDEKE